MPAPILANGALYDSAQVEEYLSMLFRNVDWLDGEVISILGIGEKGTAQEGIFRDRQIIPHGFMGMVHGHLKRWAEHHVAGFVVPAVLKAAAKEKGDVTLDKVAALTAIILDIDSGDVRAKAAFVTERLGEPTMVVASGGTTDAGDAKVHGYWLLNEPCEDVERVAALRKMLAAKVGGGQSFGRATQVIRVPGSVHAKHSKAALCTILARSTAEYSLDDLAETIENMSPMPGLPAPAQANLPALSMVGGMDFSPREDTAIAALHRDIHEGGEDLTRWGEFSKIAGFHINEARAGRIQPQAAIAAANGWMLTHMVPPWPQARFDQEFTALVNKDIANHGPFPAAPRPWSNVPVDAKLPLLYFADIKASLKNAWLVRNLLPAIGLAAIYGSPGAGKTFFAVDVGLRVAAGMSIDGRAVQKGPVIYVAAEGASGLKGRVDAFGQHHGLIDLPFAMVPCAVNLLDPNADLPRLIETINAAVERLGSSPSLIIVDTLAATFAAGDENSNAMVSYINNMAALRDEFESLVAVVHHRPKDQANDSLRGHGSLMGAMDTVIRVDGAEIKTATITKQKDAEAGPPISFRVSRFELGVDEDGEQVLGGVVDYATVVESKPLTGYALSAFDALTNLVDEAEGLPILERVWRDRWAAGLSAEKNHDAQRKGWGRARNSLLQSGRVQTEAGFWSIAPSKVALPCIMNFDPMARAA